MESHQFDRRASDVNAKSLSERLKALEDHVHDAMTPELVANTRLTKQVHEGLDNLREALMGKAEGDVSSVSFKVNEMHEAFSAAKGGLKALETIGRVAKPIAVVVTLMGVMATLLTTGHWTWPK